MAQAVESQSVDALIPSNTIKIAFDMIDTNGDGNLQKDEFYNGCNAMGMDLSLDELNKVFQLIDKDGSQEIDFQEFSNFFNSKSYVDTSKEFIQFRNRLIGIASDISPSVLRNAFDIIDKNGDGALQKDEFSAGCIAFGIKLTDNELNKVFNCIDIDQSGEIDFDEFVNFLKPEKKNNKQKEFGQFRTKLLNILLPITNVFENNFDFDNNNNNTIIVLQHFNNNDYIAVDQKNNEKLVINGKNNDEFSRFSAETELDKEDNNKKYVYLKNIKSNRYITVTENGKIVKLSNLKSDESKFRVRRISNGCYKFESNLYKNNYISIDIKQNQINTSDGIGPYSKFHCFQKGIKAIFSNNYLFTTKKVVILETRFGQHLRIEEDENNAVLNINGGKGILSQFEAEPEDGGKYVRLKSVKNGKYIRLNKEQNIIDCNGVGGNLSKFIVHCVDGPNHVRLENIENKGLFIGVDENGKGVKVGNGDKFCLLTVYYNS